MNTEERLTNLENLVNALIKRVDNDKFYNEADKAGIRQIEGVHREVIDTNTANIEYIAIMSDIDI